MNEWTRYCLLLKYIICYQTQQSGIYTCNMKILVIFNRMFACMVDYFWNVLCCTGKSCSDLKVEHVVGYLLWSKRFSYISTLFYQEWFQHLPGMQSLTKILSCSWKKHFYITKLCLWIGTCYIAFMNIKFSVNINDVHSALCMN